MEFTFSIYQKIPLATFAPQGGSPTRIIYFAAELGIVRIKIDTQSIICIIIYIIFRKLFSQYEKQGNVCMKIHTTIGLADVEKLKIYDTVEISGVIFAGRDAALPKLLELLKSGSLENFGIDLEGGAVFHTAVSPAGIGPTSSNKLEIEESIAPLSEAGIRIHIGKGKLSRSTEEKLWENGSIFVVTPPTSALLTATVTETEIAAFSELGIEALYRLTVENFPAIVAIANGKSIFRSIH
ncbi:MAG: fumarate hydratase C-terminal domain-containing protein [Synergistaceae bacterium]|jgi:fumarate hydratase subunit beta|nr:fumarate hydratase C-terminal domain-containing protein [Synergistaceae bacterium]